jgi:RimK family alpha-L-glutamate ligase
LVEDREVSFLRLNTGAILDGERNPAVLARMRDRRCHATVETIEKALAGNYRSEHLCGSTDCEDPSQLKAFVGLMKALDPKRPFLIQEYLGDRPGSDLRVLVIGGKAIGAVVRSSKDGDFRANIAAGGMGENFPLTPDIVKISETIARLLGLEIGGVDLLFSGDKFVLCEANSAPGYRGFETYCGLDVADKIAEYVERVTSGVNFP